jgi:hypothetical protein
MSQSGGGKNSLRIEKNLFVSAFLEGRNLESFGVTKLELLDIPQSLVDVHLYILRFREDVSIKEDLSVHHIQTCEKTNEIVNLYFGGKSV